MQRDLLKFRKSVIYTMSFVGLLWFIRLLESSLSFDLGVLGIHPRTITGTVGIITGPLVHGDFHHLISNSLPLIFLGIGVFYFYHKIALEVFAMIYLFTGIWVWMIARDAYHIGASGIVYGLASFLLFSGFFRKDSRSIAISLVVIFIYGGMAYGLFPMNEEISWESHLLGTIGGFFCAFFYRGHHLEHTQSEAVEMISPPVATNDKLPSEVTDHTHPDQNCEIRYQYSKAALPDSAVSQEKTIPGGASE